MTVLPFRQRGEAEVADQAMRWLMRVTDPAATPADRAACADWRRAAAAHDRAYLEAELFWRRDELADALGAFAHEVAPPRARRWPMAAAAAAVLAVVLLGIVHLALPDASPAWLSADYRAPLHGLATVVLPDGSRLHLDHGAAVDAQFTAERRTLRLRQGSIVVEAQPDANRPLVVETARAETEVIGTRFLVAHGPQIDRIAVQSGRVAVRQGGQVRQLGPGQALTVGPGLGAVTAVDPGLVADRALGWRSFEGATLAEVVAEIGRYRLAPILIRDDRLGRLQMTARLQVAAPDAALDALAGTLPIALRHLPGGLVLIEK